MTAAQLTPVSPQALATKRLNLFERYLTVWVALCMVVGVLLGKALPSAAARLRDLEFASGSQINLPIAALIWLMIIPRMM
jgi:ACR3 family arsenite transporter